jgi:integrase
LRHRDKEAAKSYALEQAAKLRKGDAEITAGVVKLFQVIDLYLLHRSPRKGEKEQEADKRRAELWKRFLGGDADPHTISLASWERFIDLRALGAIDSRAKPVPTEDRRAVRTRAISQDLQWLNWLFNWASKWRTPQGHYLLRENAVRGYDVPTERNPKRPTATEDRYQATRAKTNDVTMEIRGHGKAKIVRSYLSEILDIVSGTGRRLSAVLQLQYQDLALQDGPHGTIRWPASSDKTGRETTVPIGPDVRAAIDRVHRERPGIGKAYLFPAPRNLTKPISRHLAAKWLQEAEKLAGLEKLDGSLWHAYRRKWATERKHLPDIDVARAGGWTNPNTLRLVYQQADQDTMLRVVLERGELREAK